MKIVVIDKENTFAGCWISDSEYPRMDREYIHQAYACGQGMLVRHLCSNKHCINPVHLIRGNNDENMADEVNKKDFMSYVMISEMDGLPEVFNRLKIDYVEYEYLMYYYIKWKEEKDIYWDEDCARSYLEGIWRKVFKEMVTRGIYQEYLGNNIVNEQLLNASALMRKIKFKRNVSIVEV